MQRETATWDFVRFCLPYLKRHHPTWTAEQVLTEAGIPAIPEIVRLLRAARFPSHQPVGSTIGERERVLEALNLGIWSSQVIAEETGISRERVQRIIATDAGFGLQPFGMSEYGRCKHRSVDGQAVSRRITPRGQVTYRRRTYSLGRLYRGRIAWIAERDRLLLVTVADRPTLELPIDDR
jgi:hypothetical protein